MDFKTLLQEHNMKVKRVVPTTIRHVDQPRERGYPQNKRENTGKKQAHPNSQKSPDPITNTNTNTDTNINANTNTNKNINANANANVNTNAEPKKPILIKHRNQAKNHTPKSQLNENQGTNVR